MTRPNTQDGARRPRINADSSAAIQGLKSLMPRKSDFQTIQPDNDFKPPFGLSQMKKPFKKGNLVGMQFIKPTNAARPFSMEARRSKPRWTEQTVQPKESLPSVSLDF